MCVWGGGGGQARCERRSEGFVEIQKKVFVGGLLGGGGEGVRVGFRGGVSGWNANEELKFLWKLKKMGWGRVGGGGGGRFGDWVVSRWM